MPAARISAGMILLSLMVLPFHRKMVVGNVIIRFSGCLYQPPRGLG